MAATSGASGAAIVATAAGAGSGSAPALYACTKCNQRYPFEELSQGQQLCKVPLPRAEAAVGREGGLRGWLRPARRLLIGGLEERLSPGRSKYLGFIRIRSLPGKNDTRFRTLART